MVTIFPANVLGIKVELLLNAVWTDISAYAMQESDIHITGQGRSDWTGTIQAAGATMTLKNTDGRFSPKNTAGANYPYIARNVQIRISVNSESSTLVVYNNYRFWGEVTEWKVHWDETGKYVVANIAAAGIWERLSQDQVNLGSAFLRYYTITLTGSNIPQAYWAMEDGTGATAFIHTIGASNATWTGQPSLAADSSFKGSDAIPSLAGSIITANVPAGGTATNNVTRFLLSVPAGGDSSQGSANWCLTETDSAGTVAKLETYLQPNGKINVQGRDSGGTVRFTGTTTTNVQGVPVLVSAELAPSGSNIAWALKLIRPGDLSVLETVSGTYTTASISTVSAVKVNRAGILSETAIGHLAVLYQIPSLVTAAYPLNGYSGEYALDRFVRLCNEQGIGNETLGVNTTSAAMGPQTDDTLTNLLQLIEDTDGGVLYEARGQFGLGFRTQTHMSAQSVVVTLNYTHSDAVSIADPIFDQQLTKNNITLDNWDGYVINGKLTVGAMSIQAPPNGIGPGYSVSRNVSFNAHGDISTFVTHLLNVYAVDEPRIPSVVVNIGRSEVVALFASVPGLRIGDYIQITNPPSFFSASVIKQLIWGYEETLNAFDWIISFNTVPESPWEVGFTPGTVVSAQAPNSAVTQSASSSAQSTLGVVQNGISQGLTVFPSNISNLTASLIGQLGVLNLNPYFIGGDGTNWTGVNGTFVVSAPPAGIPFAWSGFFTQTTSGGYAAESATPFPVVTGQQYLVTAWIYTPQTHCIIGFDWQNSSHAFLSTSTQDITVPANTWTQVTTVQTAPASAAFAYERITSTAGIGNSIYMTSVTCLPQVPGSLIQAGTVTATQIAAATITVGLLAAGIVYAGIVDATTITGAVVQTASGTPCVIMDGARDAIFGFDAATNLLFSLAGATGTDPFTHAYPAGLYSQQVTLIDVASAPGAFSGASVLFSDANGRLWFNNDAGASAVLKRSTVNVSQFTAASTSPSNIAGVCNYKGGESNQSSEFAIEISGLLTMDSTAVKNTIFELYIDGAATSPVTKLTLTNPWTTTQVAAYTIRATISFLSTGAAATAVCILAGYANLSGSAASANSVNLNSGPGSGSAVAIDSTVNHTFQLKGYFATGITNQTMTTYRTEILRGD